MGYFYYEYINKETIAERSILIGNMAHEMRNTLQGFVTQYYPQFQALDQQHGQIEAQCRQILNKLSVENDLKEHLRILTRQVLFINTVLLQTVPDFMVNKVGKEMIDEMVDQTEVMKSCIQDIDREINAGIIQDTAVNFADKGVKCSTLDEMKGYIQKVDKVFLESQDLGKLKLGEPVGVDDFNGINRGMMVEICNRAHQMQTTVCPFLSKTPMNGLSDRVINLAGAIENHARKMQEIQVNDKVRFVGDTVGHMKGIQNGYLAQCAEIAKGLEEIHKSAEAYQIPRIKAELIKLWERTKQIHEVLKANMDVFYTHPDMF
jgi:hypothetical protein